MKIRNDPTWTDAIAGPSFPKLKTDLEAEIVVIGAGLAGILTTYLFSKAGKPVILLEQNKTVASGVTMATTAHITQVLDTDLADLIKMFGIKKTKQLWQSGGEAIDMFATIIREERIECQFKRVDFYEYARESEDFTHIEQEYEAAQKLSVRTELLKKTDVGFKTSGAWKVPNQAKFHPINFARGVAEVATRCGARIFTQAEVNDITGNKTLIIHLTNGLKVKAQNVIVTTYKPIKTLKTFAKKGTYKTYVFEVEIAKNLIPDGLYEDTYNPYHYFRIDNGDKKARMIVGGEDHRAELKINPNKNFKALETYLKDVLGNHKYAITRKWTGPILEPSDGLALIGRSKPGQYVATGFSGTGMIYSMIAAMIFRDLILKRKNSWIKLYDPTRIPSAKQLAYKLKDYTGELVHGALKNLIKK